MERKSLYNKKGMYAGYDKNHKEREKLDYYSTPTEEVYNILDLMRIPLSKATILEPCCGGGHMVQGIVQYIDEQKYDSKLWKLIATDIQKRKSILRDCDWQSGKDYDFLSDHYPYIEDIDYIIMNPPFSLIEPFVMKSLGIANKGILMLGRLQFLESEKRYNNILKDYPPSDVYVYVDRIVCYKNGDINLKPDGIQAYAWYYWNCTENSKETKVHWIRRYNKRES